MTTLHQNGDGDTVNCDKRRCKIYHVEVCQDPRSTVTSRDIVDRVRQYLQKSNINLGDFSLTEFTDDFLSQHVRHISMSDTKFSRLEAVSLDTMSVQYHVYQLHQDGPGTEGLEDEEDLAAASHWILPSQDFDGIWDRLVFDVDIKEKLLSYAATTVLFSDKNVDANVISWNKVILLHGPPGTGKTSLCKALAQKLCIRMSDRFTYGQLIEINSHSLFSKWFSESGKLVMKMFQKIQDLISDKDALVCVLIDEVESLTAARKSAMSGSEPSDAIRVVNAVLTQLDQIKKYPNVLVLTTSNVTGAIDLAFVDRADIKQYIGLPSPDAIYTIYRSCVEEMMKTEIIRPVKPILDLKTLDFMRYEESEVTRVSLRLREVAQRSRGLSGRTLRKLPFIAQAVFVQANVVTVEDFLVALDSAVKQQFMEREELAKD